MPDNDSGTLGRSMDKFSKSANNTLQQESNVAKG